MLLDELLQHLDENGLDLGRRHLACGVRLANSFQLNIVLFLCLHNNSEAATCTYLYTQTHLQEEGEVLVCNVNFHVGALLAVLGERRRRAGECVLHDLVHGDDGN